MVTTQQEEETREIAIEAFSLIWGRAMFAFIRLPASWVTGYQLNEPFVTNRFLYKNLIWVGVGEIECLISRALDKEKRADLEFKLKLKVDLQSNELVSPTVRELKERHERKGHQIVKHGELIAGGHKGSFILWTTQKPRFILFGKRRLSVKLEGYIPCDDTKRLLELSWTSPSPSLVLEHAEELINIFNSVLCHGHEVVPDDKLWF